MPTVGTSAIVVTYMPTESIAEHLGKIGCQTNQVIVVDNGSHGDALDRLHEACSNKRIILIENGTNLGIGAALNIGIEYARTRGCRWIALFDQDTTIPDNYLNKMLQCVSLAGTDRIAIVGPCYRNPVTGIVSHSSLAERDGGPLEVMTSGSLISVEAFEQCGGFNEDFFIDQVDHEYCFRVRERGFRVLLCEDAILDHSPGTPTVKMIFGRRSVRFFNHAPWRLYYQTRNTLILAWRYRRIYPDWSNANFKQIFYSGPILVLLAEHNRMSRLWYMIRGIFDGVFGRVGKRLHI